MTRLMSPNSSEYNFQHREIENTATSLKAMLDNSVDMDLVNISAKVVSKDPDVQTVGSSNLKRSEYIIADNTCALKLVLWEANIDQLSVGHVYTLKDVRIKENDQEENGRILNTTPDTVIIQNDDELLFRDVPLLENTKQSGYAQLQVDSIHSIEEFSHFKQCSNCLKKIKQDSSNVVIKCDHCGHTVRSSSCEVVTVVKFLVTNKTEGSSQKFVRFVPFNDILEKMIGPIKTMEDDMIVEKLLSLENFVISHSKENIVKDVKISG